MIAQRAFESLPEPIAVIYRRTNMITDLSQELRFRARRLMKQPGVLLIALLTPAVCAGFTQVAQRTIPLDALNEMQPRNVKMERVSYKGRDALRVTDTAAANVIDGNRLVILSKTEFQDGVIEIELA